MFVLKFKTIFLKRILKGALFCHSIFPNSIGSEILMVQTLYSRTVLLSVNHYIRLLFLSKKKLNKPYVKPYVNVGTKHVCRSQVADNY